MNKVVNNLKDKGIELIDNYISDKVKNKVVDYLKEKAIELIDNYISDKVKDYKKKKLWRESVEKACEATEEIDEFLQARILSSTAVKRHFLMLVDGKNLDMIYYSFIITIAFELCYLNSENKFSKSLGIAILDNWFELNEIENRYFKSKLVDVKNEIDELINDREKLYCAYFKLYEEPDSDDIVRVYYPKNGESWVSWNKQYSVDIKTNLSKGAELGFCRIGFSYDKIDESGIEKPLKIAYVDKDREIFRFSCYECKDKSKVLWEY